MGIFKSFINSGYAGAAEVEPNFVEYDEVFGKRPALMKRRPPDCRHFA